MDWGATIPTVFTDTQTELAHSRGSQVGIETDYGLDDW
jgi:hypothetical protein